MVTDTGIDQHTPTIRLRPPTDTRHPRAVPLLSNGREVATTSLDHSPSVMLISSRSSIFWQPQTVNQLYREDKETHAHKYENPEYHNATKLPKQQSSETLSWTPRLAEML